MKIVKQIDQYNFYSTQEVWVNLTTNYMWRKVFTNIQGPFYCFCCKKIKFKRKVFNIEYKVSIVDYGSFTRFYYTLERKAMQINKKIIGVPLPKLMVTVADSYI